MHLSICGTGLGFAIELSELNRITTRAAGAWNSVFLYLYIYMYAVAMQAHIYICMCFASFLEHICKDMLQDGL